MAPFYGLGSTASRPESLRGGSLLFNRKFPEVPGTHFIDLGRIKSWVDLATTQWFWTCLNSTSMVIFQESLSSTLNTLRITFSLLFYCFYLKLTKYFCWGRWKNSGGSGVHEFYDSHRLWLDCTLSFQK